MKCGIKYKDFMHMTMREVLAEIDGYHARMQETIETIEWSAWLFGVYTSYAINSTIGNSPWFKGKGVPNFEYPKKPLGGEDSDKNSEEVEKTDEEKAVENVFMQLQILGMNHKLQKNQKDESNEGARQDTIVE